MKDGFDAEENTGQSDCQTEKKKKSFYRPTPEELRKMLWAAGVFLGVGGYLAATVFFTAYVGDWCDGKLGTAPFGRVVGLILGAPIAIWGLYDQYKNFDRR